MNLLRVGRQPRKCRACGKRRWTEAGAIAEAARRMALGAVQLGTYRCPKGNDWHLTSKPYPKTRDVPRQTAVGEPGRGMPSTSRSTQPTQGDKS